MLLHLEHPRGFEQPVFLQDRPHVDPMGWIDDAAERESHQEEDDDRMRVAHAIDTAHRTEKAASPFRHRPWSAHGLMRDRTEQKNREYPVNDKKYRPSNLHQLPPSSPTPPLRLRACADAKPSSISRLANTPVLRRHVARIL